MAKLCSVNRNEKRRKLSKRHGKVRDAVKAKIMDRNLPPEERFELVLKLAEMPRNSAKIRIRNRCAVTGRPRAVHRKFNLCRNAIRFLANHGELPGVVKSSW